MLLQRIFLCILHFSRSQHFCPIVLTQVAIAVITRAATSARSSSVAIAACVGFTSDRRLRLSKFTTKFRDQNIVQKMAAEFVDATHRRPGTHVFCDKASLIVGSHWVVRKQGILTKHLVVLIVLPDQVKLILHTRTDTHNITWAIKDQLVANCKEQMDSSRSHKQPSEDIPSFGTRIWIRP